MAEIKYCVKQNFKRILLLTIFLAFIQIIRNFNISITSTENCLNYTKSTDEGFLKTQKMTNVKETEATIQETLIQCVHKMENYGNKHDGYVTVSNIIQPTTDTNTKTTEEERDDVSLCTQCSTNHLSNLIQISKDWAGPISVTVFTYKLEQFAALYSIAYLRACVKNIRKHVTFHLVFPTSPPLNKLNTHYENNLTCNKDLHRQLNGGLQYGNKQLKTNYEIKNDISYPVNFLRNVSIFFAKSAYVFLTDIDLVPSTNMHDLVQQFIYNHRIVNISFDQDVAFVVPCFEYHKVTFPSINKIEALQQWKHKTLRQFYITQCYFCHYKEDLTRWFSLPHQTTLHVAYFVKWHFPWEPFYIARKDGLPEFDSRFKQFGLNRVSQQCEMAIKGYRFGVLDQVFLTHGGFKDGNPNRRKIQDIRRNIQLYQLFREEVKRRYSVNDVSVCGT